MRLIKECPVLAVPRTKGENTLALSIVKQAADIRGKEIVYTDFPMTRDKEVLNKNYDRIAGLLAEYLEKGQNVAMLNIGDISIYSTFSYVGERVARAGFPVRVCAGVPCFCDIAAKTGKPLVSGSQVLMVIPAGKEALDPYMELEGTKVLMKSGESWKTCGGIWKKRGWRIGRLSQATAACPENISCLPPARYRREAAILLR